MWQALSKGGNSTRDTVIVNWDKGTGAIIKKQYKLVVSRCSF